jgi:hypothetical protein
MARLLLSGQGKSSKTPRSPPKNKSKSSEAKDLPRRQSLRPRNRSPAVDTTIKKSVSNNVFDTFLFSHPFKLNFFCYIITIYPL